jgi:hypothetical protein
MHGNTRDHDLVWYIIWKIYVAWYTGTPKIHNNTEIAELASEIVQLINPPDVM